MLIFPSMTVLQEINKSKKYLIFKRKKAQMVNLGSVMLTECTNCRFFVSFPAEVLDYHSIKPPYHCSRDRETQQGQLKIIAPMWTSEFVTWAQWGFSANYMANPSIYS